MSEITILVLLFGVGAVALVLEVFLPSHGVLTLVGLGFLGVAVYCTFDWVGREAGVVALASCVIGVPTLAYVAIKHWRNTWLGRRIAPPNPIVSSGDSAIPVNEISALVGRSGRSVSPLRPVGICDFDGKRISCVAQYGLIEAGVEVEGVGIMGGTLKVAPSAQVGKRS